MSALSHTSERKIGRPVGISKTRERLIDEASYLFAERGFAGTTLREICDRLGISGPALLHHFGTKKRLYAEVLGEIAGSMSQYIPGEGEVGDRNGVLNMVERYFDWTLLHPHLSQLIMRELMENRERVDRTRNLSMKPVMAACAEYMQRGQKAGTLPKFDADIFAFFYTGAVAHFVAAAPTVRRIVDANSDDKVLQRFRRTLLESIDAMLDGYLLAPSSRKLSRAGVKLVRNARTGGGSGVSQQTTTVVPRDRCVIRYALEKHATERPDAVFAVYRVNSARKT